MNTMSRIKGRAAAMLGIVAAATLSSAAMSVPQQVITAKAVTAKSDPAKQQKQTPADTKTNRLGDGNSYRRRQGAYCGKRARHTVAQGRRLAAKKRNVKRARG